VNETETSYIKGLKLKKAYKGAGRDAVNLYHSNRLCNRESQYNAQCAMRNAYNHNHIIMHSLFFELARHCHHCHWAARAPAGPAGPGDLWLVESAMAMTNTHLFTSRLGFKSNAAPGAAGGQRAACKPPYVHTRALPWGGLGSSPRGLVVAAYSYYLFTQSRAALALACGYPSHITSHPTPDTRRSPTPPRGGEAAAAGPRQSRTRRCKTEESRGRASRSLRPPRPCTCLAVGRGLSIIAAAS